jgi:hypothetical protein
MSHNRDSITLLLIFAIVLFGLLLGASLTSCKKIDSDGYRIFTIKENKHRSTSSYNTTKSKLISFKCIFDSSAIYETCDSLNQYDVNKLYGISDCGYNHKEYSIRVGWRWLNDSLEILWFKHQYGIFSFEKIKTIDLCKEYDYSIEILEDEYIICIDGDCKSTPRNCHSDNRNYYLYPYFGGDERSPHDITIRIK